MTWGLGVLGVPPDSPWRAAEPVAVFCLTREPPPSQLVLLAAGLLDTRAPVLALQGVPTESLSVGGPFSFPLKALL